MNPDGRTAQAQCRPGRDNDDSCESHHGRRHHEFAGAKRAVLSYGDYGAADPTAPNGHSTSASYQAKRRHTSRVATGLFTSSVGPSFPLAHYTTPTTILAISLNHIFIDFRGRRIQSHCLRDRARAIHHVPFLAATQAQRRATRACSTREYSRVSKHVHERVTYES